MGGRGGGGGGGGGVGGGGGRVKNVKKCRYVFISFSIFKLAVLYLFFVRVYPLSFLM